MIENDFEEKDTLAERVTKLNGQTGLGLILRDGGGGRFYLEQEGRYFTGAMRPHELRHWTADFARGFRLGDAAARGEAPPHVEEVSPRPGTRMLDLQPPSSDPLRQAAESIEELKKFHGRRRGRMRGGPIGAPRDPSTGHECP